MFAFYKSLVTSLLLLLLFFQPFVIAQAVNINTATSTELQSIKGIGEKTAQRIIDERARGGDFESAEDLSIRIKGLGKKRTEKLIEAGLDIGPEQSKQNIGSSVVAKEVAAVKQRFKYAAPSSSSGPYLLKVN
ncbi:MAG: DUF655 domain-containing protein [Alcaligenaceae bacterium]|jgi:competence protein ComEA|nr:DUF655 domain-containing protein [Alcaligenaceae bacterium]